MRRGATAGAMVAAIGCLVACAHESWDARHQGPEGGSLDRDAPYLKAHTHSGRVFVLERWEVDSERGIVEGDGLLYDAQREVLAEGRHEIPLGTVAMLETNRPDTVIHAGAPVLGLVSTGVIAGVAACANKPKACFGSCPTFYVPGKDGMRLQAEGFSASVLERLESTDVDSLYDARPRTERLTVLMRNEALETHRVRHVRMLAVRRERGERVLRAGEDFYAARAFHAPEKCRSPQGSCVEAVRDRDGAELASPADGEDLGAEETVRLRFPAAAGPGDRLGLVVEGRNSLVQTFLFYQLLAYLGRDAGKWLSAFERGALGIDYDDKLAFWRELGRIEVSVRGPGGRWRRAGVHYEVGPIARDVQVVPLARQLTAEDKPIEVRLRMTRGYWKLDRLALAELDETRSPQVLRPREVRRAGHSDRRALARLRDADQYLTTYPGDDYELVFELPEGSSYELFLQSRGYYYEWIRQQWLEDQDPARFLRYLAAPQQMLRELAPAYKKLEPRVDETFWRSRMDPLR